MLAIIKTAGHYIIGLAVLGTVGGLAGVGVLTADQVIGIIGAVSLPLIGAGISSAGTTSSTPIVTLKPKT